MGLIRSCSNLLRRLTGGGDKQNAHRRSSEGKSLLDASVRKWRRGGNDQEGREPGWTTQPTKVPTEARVAIDSISATESTSIESEHDEVLKLIAEQEKLLQDLDAKMATSEEEHARLEHGMLRAHKIAKGDTPSALDTSSDIIRRFHRRRSSEQPSPGLEIASPNANNSFLDLDDSQISMDISAISFTN